MRNLGTLDRVVRVALVMVCLVVGFFWADKGWQIFLYLVAVMLSIQAATGTCGVYALLKINTCPSVKRRSSLLLPSLLLILVLGAAATYISASMTREIFQQDLDGLANSLRSAMDSIPEDQVTSSGSHDFGTSFLELDQTVGRFREKYIDYRPLVVKFDPQFEPDLEEITLWIQQAQKDIASGNYLEARQRLKGTLSIVEQIDERVQKS